MTETVYLGVVLIYWSQYRINKTLFQVGRERRAVQMSVFSLRKILLRAKKTKDHRGGKKKNNLTCNRKYLIHFTVLTSIFKYLCMKNAFGTELGAAKYAACTGYQHASAVGFGTQCESSTNVPSWSPLLAVNYLKLQLPGLMHTVSAQDWSSSTASLNSLH